MLPGSRVILTAKTVMNSGEKVRSLSPNNGAQDPSIKKPCIRQTVNSAVDTGVFVRKEGWKQLRGDFECAVLADSAGYPICRNLPEATS